MFKSLYSKLAIVLLGLFCLLGISIFMITQFTSDIYQQEVIQKLNLNLANQIAIQKDLMRDQRINEQGLKEIFTMLMAVNPGIEVYLLNPAGDILAYSAPPGKVKQNRVDLKPINKWFEAETVYPLTGDDPRNPGRKKVFTVARIPEKGPLQGYLYIILVGENFDSIVQKLKSSYIRQLGLWWIAASLLFTLTTGLLLFAYLTRRLRRLVSIMDSFDIEQTVAQLHSNLSRNRLQGDEIDRLSFTFNQLVERIQIQMDNLKKADGARRQLVANVSHDLRTPLATLRGYIETLLLKEEDLPVEDRKHHLDIALQHCERLSKLVDELFELAKLDSHEIEVNYESFNIRELAHDIAQKFELSAKKRQITIRIDLDSSIPFVFADIAMIERVIENLIENAMRYTPPGGSIRLKFDTQNGDVVMHVSDTGCGISEEDLPFIFDRFYQRNKTQNKKTGYSGLGLAITKRILELHNKTISVHSSPPKGTQFTFSLPAK